MGGALRASETRCSGGTRPSWGCSLPPRHHPGVPIPSEGKQRLPEVRGWRTVGSAAPSPFLVPSAPAHPVAGVCNHLGQTEGCCQLLAPLSIWEARGPARWLCLGTAACSGCCRAHQYLMGPQQAACPQGIRPRGQGEPAITQYEPLLQPRVVCITFLLHTWKPGLKEAVTGRSGSVTGGPGSEPLLSRPRHCPPGADDLMSPVTSCSPARRPLPDSQGLRQGTQREQRPFLVPDTPQDAARG